MRADRLLSALLLLQAHGKLTGRELASRLEVSVRTVHRDMEALGTAGVPVFALRGVRGGWQLDAGWRTHVPGLDDGELRALLMTQPRIVGDTRLADAAERALNKLLAALPLALRQRAAAIRQRLHVDTTGWFGRAENLSALPAVQDALARDRALLITYRKRNRDQTERTVDPLGLVVKGAVWYLVGNTPRGYRTFRVSRIEQATPLDTPVERPAGFDLAAYWRHATHAFREARRFRVTVRAEPVTAELLERWAHGALVVAPDEPRRWRTLTIDFDDVEQARFTVLGFGSRVEVLAPDSLRQMIDAEHEAIGKRLAARTS